MQHKRSGCCDKGNLAITWRLPHPIHGPEHEGWSMVLHVMIGTPEYSNIKTCPFCCNEPLNIETEKE